MHYTLYSYKQYPITLKIYTLPYYPIFIVVHTLWSFQWLAPLDRHEAGKEFVSCTDLTKIDENNFKTSI